jgi:hypothetical protein
MTISSPALTLRRPQACATRLTPSVVPRMNTISFGDDAPTNRRTLSRAAS